MDEKWAEVDVEDQLGGYYHRIQPRDDGFLGPG